jgi:hypothetical protein
VNALAVGVSAAAPEIPVGVWIFTLVTLTAGIATALKGRYVWLALGLFLLGVPWLISCLLLAKPGSAWATALYGPEKLSRAERRASRRLPHLRA